jgi:hypothetical protein
MAEALQRALSTCFNLGLQLAAHVGADGGDSVKVATIIQEIP